MSDDDDHEQHFRVSSEQICFQKMLLSISRGKGNRYGRRSSANLPNRCVIHCVMFGSSLHELVVVVSSVASNMV